MDIGNSVCAIIAARNRWNDTAINLVSGEEYDFHANGEWIDWLTTRMRLFQRPATAYGDESIRIV